MDLQEAYKYADQSAYHDQCKGLKDFPLSEENKWVMVSIWNYQERLVDPLKEASEENEEGLGEMAAGSAPEQKKGYWGKRQEIKIQGDCRYLT